MSRSPTEKYEQLLAQDPTSTVFVELARALLELGDNERAIQVCKQGVSHHPESVVGRVLWGRALINTGKAADAMSQFDLAMGINRENPHAYNLISEVLLRKGLYRSALPILRKASALQPNDGRIKNWLDQTKAALAGGPAPVLEAIAPAEPEEAATALINTGPAPRAPEPAATGEELQEAPTAVMDAFRLPPLGATADAPTGEFSPPRASPPGPVELPVVQGRVTHELPRTEAPDPFASVPSRTDNEPDILRGLTNTFDALGLSADAPAPPAPPPGEPSVIPAEEHLLPAPQRPESRAPLVVGANTEADSEAREVPTRELTLPSTGDSGPSWGAGHRPLLEDIPEQHTYDPPSGNALPRLDFNTQATEAIAKEYERELRVKLEAKTKKKTFLQQHGLKVALAVLIVVALAAGGGGFIATRIKHKGESLESAIAKALAATTADTKEQYLAALESLDSALSMDDSSAKAWARKGYAHAILFAEHGRQASDREQALGAFQRPRVREAHPELAVVVDSLTATGEAAASAREQLMNRSVDASEVHAEAGRVLLSEKKYDEALKRLQKAVELDSKNVRALVALGDYYLAFDDFEQAARVLEGPAAQLSNHHPGRVMGLTEARLKLGRDAAEALSDLEQLPKFATVPAAQQGRYAVMLGRALSANGRHADAAKVLEDGLADHAPMAFEFQMALGGAHRAAGRMAEAQQAYEEAVKLRPKVEEAREGLGRVLLARSREKELLERLRPEKEARSIALVRGIAAWRLGDLKRARQELSGTQQAAGKFPAEAVVYLALIDASEESSDRAVQRLEALATQSKRHRATVQVALARVHLQRGALDKARAQLEEAAKDPADYEGNVLLGELLLTAGLPPALALEPLQRAVTRNGSHAPARRLLIRALLAQGRLPDAIKNAEAWAQDNPALDQAWTQVALVYLRAGRAGDARAAADKAVKLGADSVDAHRVAALVNFALGEPKAGFAELERANQLDPKDPETFCEIGNAFVRQSNYETALKAYEAAVRENGKSVCGLLGPHRARPGLRGARGVLGGLLKGAHNDAWVKASIQATLSRVLLEERDLRGALAAAEEAAEAQPGMTEAWLALGEVQHRLKDEAKALESLKKAAALDGSWAFVHFAYAEALSRAGPEHAQTALAEYDLVRQLSMSDGEQAKVKGRVAALNKQFK